MKKINLYLISGILSVALFFVLTLIQWKLVNNTKFQTAFIAVQDIKSEEKITNTNIKAVKVPEDLITGTNAILDEKELADKYAVTDIFKGEIIFSGNLESKDKLKIVEVDSGLERISINIDKPENAVSYQLKSKDRIHLYFTGRTGVIRDSFERYDLKLETVENDNAMQTVKLIENVEILGIYDEFGLSCEENEAKTPDTIVLGVTAKEAEIVNNLRDQGVFDITR